MDRSFNDLYEEIVAMKEDLEEHLETKELSPHVKKLAEEELYDLNATIDKWENGYFGICEQTGTFIPPEVLTFQPTVRSFNEIGSILKYFKKPVYPI